VRLRGNSDQTARLSGPSRGCTRCLRAARPASVTVASAVAKLILANRYGTLDANSKESLPVRRGRYRDSFGPSAPACELGIFSLSVAEMPQWERISEITGRGG
jgi:hypothetical protein